jgi:hypothetical protein
MYWVGEKTYLQLQTFNKLKVFCSELKQNEILLHIPNGGKVFLYREFEILMLRQVQVCYTMTCLNS